MMNEPRSIIELSDAELDQVSGGQVGTGVLQEGNGNLNFHSNAPNTPAADHGFKGNGAQIVNLCSC
jgi:bacteriocin-like protein